MNKINAKQNQNMFSFQDKYLHQDIIIENNDRHIFIDLDKKIKELKECWKDKNAFYSILREIDNEIIGEDVFNDEDKEIYNQDLKSKKIKANLNQNHNHFNYPYNHKINSNNVSILSHDDLKINNHKRYYSPLRDVSSLTNNNFYMQQKHDFTSIIPSKLNLEYETERYKSNISTIRNYNNKFENNYINDTSPNSRFLQRKNSLGVNNQKPLRKKYNDVHANSKLHYLYNLDNSDKHLIEPSQWNDTTNRYFYLREQSPTISPMLNNSNYKNYHTYDNLNSGNLDVKNNYFDYIKQVSEISIGSPTSYNTNKNFDFDRNNNFNRNYTGGFSSNYSNYKNF